MALPYKDYEINPIVTWEALHELLFFETHEEKILRKWQRTKSIHGHRQIPNPAEMLTIQERFIEWVKGTVKVGELSILNAGTHTDGLPKLEFYREDIFNWLLSKEVLQNLEADGIIISDEVYDLVRRYAAPIKNAPENAFIRDGDYWHITYKGKKLPLIKHSDGIGYIAYLLERPNKKVDVLDLRDAIKGVPDKDTGNMTSSEAKEGSHDQGATLIDSKGVRTILEEIENLKGDLKVANGKEEQEDIEEEIQKAQKILDASTDNQGKGRLFVNEHERARQTITKGIALSRRKIAAYDEDLSEVLKQSLSGLIYKPDPDNPIHWTITP